MGMGAKIYNAAYVQGARSGRMEVFRKVIAMINDSADVTLVKLFAENALRVEEAGEEDETNE